MSAPRWKPGDVGVVGGMRVMRDAHGWRFADGSTAAEYAVPASPLVVIDPEDREQVEALRMAFVAAGVWRPETSVGDAHGIIRRQQMQAALRSLVANPKPDEPLGLGAVVEDVDGNLYVRVDDSDNPWRDAGSGTYWRWLALGIVKVCDAGWSE